MEQFVTKIESVIGEGKVKEFFTKLKEELAKIPKENEKKDLDITVKSHGDTPNQTGFEIFSIGSKDFDKYIKADDAAYKDAVSILSLSFGAKDEESAKKLEESFAGLKPMIEQIPYFQEYQKHGGEIKIKVEGKKIILEAIGKNPDVLAKLKDINIDFSEYHEFKFELKSAFNFMDFWTKPVEEIAENSVKILLSLHGSTTNGKYLATALINAIQPIEIKDEKLNRKKKRTLTFLKSVIAFVNAKLNVEYNAKELSQILLPKLLKAIGTEGDPQESFEGSKMMIKGSAGEMGKSTLEGMGQLETVKSLDIDSIEISLLTPEYKNGLSFVLKLPGVSESISKELLA